MNETRRLELGFFAEDRALEGIAGKGDEKSEARVVFQALGLLLTSSPSPFGLGLLYLVRRRGLAKVGIRWPSGHNDQSSSDSSGVRLFAWAGGCSDACEG